MALIPASEFEAILVYRTSSRTAKETLSANKKKMLFKWYFKLDTIQNMDSMCLLLLIFKGNFLPVIPTLWRLRGSQF